MKQLPKPPKWANHFLQWFVDEDLLEEIQGDLHEAYYYRIEKEGLTKARWLFVEDVFRFFRPYAFEKYSNAKQFLPMFNNYFKIAFRNILHRKQFTAINLLGLSIGISAVLLIGLYLQNEWTYDQSVPGHERIYRLANGYRDQMYAPMSFGNYNNSTPSEQLKLVNQLKAYEGVEEAGHFVLSGSAISGTEQYYIRTNGKEFIQQKILFTNTGQQYLDLFPPIFLMGNLATAFTDYRQVILTEEMADRYFGSDWQQQEILGQFYTFDSLDYAITGVIENPPTNLHFDFDVILHQTVINCWAGYTYFKISPNNSIEKVVAQLNQEIDQVYPGYTEDELSKGVKAIPLTDIHFTKDLLYELKPIANKAYLNTFGVIAFIILLIIWTNYTNLSIAMYASRQKELGMRKVMGARSQDISLQLLVEAVLLTLLCLPIAWILLRCSLPFINEHLGWALETNILYQLPTLLAMFGILLLTGLLSGLYPALTYGQKNMVQLFSATLSGRLYLSEYRASKFMSGLSFVAIILALMGLAGIVSYIAFNRQKEIGIRKVFGASQKDILWMMNKDFVVLMLVAVLIATPFALYLTKQWLTNFAYSIVVNPLIVILSGVIALGLVLVVVTWQSRKAMNKNPIETLKYH